MDTTFGLITPSYAPDFQRCELLVHSIEKYVAQPFTHYIVVDQVDYKRFGLLQNSYTQILTVESLLPWWIWREPIWRKVWLSWKTLPVRNWILQQIVKLAAAQQIKEDVAVFIDSDVAFVAPFQLSQFSRHDQVRLYRDDVGNAVQRSLHWKWHLSAAQLLDVAPESQRVPDYIGNLITWRKQTVQQLCTRLEQVGQRPWLEVLAGTWNLSEYVLYGLFVDRVLQDRTMHYPDARNLCHDYWYAQRLTPLALQLWMQERRADQVAIMISAKSGMNVSDYVPWLPQLSSTY